MDSASETNMINGIKEIYNKIKYTATHLDLDDFAPGTHSIKVKIDAEQDAELKKTGSKDTLDDLLNKLNLTERAQKTETHYENHPDFIGPQLPRLPVIGDYFVNRGKASMHGITQSTYYIDNIGHLASEKIRMGLIEIEQKHPTYFLEKPSIWHKIYEGKKIPKLKSNRN